MDWRRKFADHQNAISQRSADKLAEEFTKLYAEAAEELVPMIVDVYKEALSSAGDRRKLAPTHLFQLDSYWDLHINSKARVEDLGHTILLLTNSQFHTMYVDVFEGITPGGLKFPCTISADEIQSVINGVWGVDKKNWRHRVWLVMTRFWDGLVGDLMEAVIKKRDPKKLQGSLQERFDKSLKTLNSTIMTDVSRIQCKAAVRRYKISRAMAKNSSTNVAAYVMAYGDEAEINELSERDVAAVNILSDTIGAISEEAIILASDEARAGGGRRSSGDDEVFLLWICEADDLVCDECAEYDQQVITEKEAEAIYPIHPNCRCVLEPIEEDDDDGEDDELSQGDLNGGQGAPPSAMDDLGGYLNSIGAL